MNDDSNITPPAESDDYDNYHEVDCLIAEYEAKKCQLCGWLHQTRLQV